MSERGKYWNEAKFGRVPRSELPTQTAPDTQQPVTKRVAEEGQKRAPQPTPETVQKSTRLGTVLALSGGMLVSGAAATLGGAYLMKAGPFAPQEQTTQTAPSSSAKDMDPYPPMPQKIRNSKDLKEELKREGVAATANDFDFETGKADLHMKVVWMRPIAGNERLGVKDSYTWEKVAERIKKDIDNDQFLVAVQLRNPYALSQIEKAKEAHEIDGTIRRLLVPDGYHYTAMAVDENDPTIVYFYYNSCTNRKPSPQALAQIGIPNPSKPKSLMSARSFQIPVCIDEENPVESDPDIQD